MDTTTMIGHNTGLGTLTHQLNTAVAGFGLALQDLRHSGKSHKEQMVLAARYLVLVDEAAGDDEDLADREIRAARIINSTDLLASAQERINARWLARGGVARSISAEIGKNLNEIKDLSTGGLNPLEARFLAPGKFAKVMTYSGLYSSMASEAKTKIRKALEGAEGAPSLPSIHESYADSIFKAETVQGWVDEENYRRSDVYLRGQDLKKAWSMKLEAEVARIESNPENAVKIFDTLEAHVKKELKAIRDARAKAAAEAEAKKAEAKLTVKQRRVLAEADRNTTDVDLGDGITDDD